MKTCIRCTRSLPRSDFYADSRNSDGLRGVCKGCELAEQARRRLANIEAARKYGREYYANRRQELAEMARKSRSKAPEAANERGREWRNRNREKMRELYRRRDERQLSTPQGRLQKNIAVAIRRYLKPGSKGGRRTFDLLGYSVEDLRRHLESLFLPGMTWENRKDWHVDHICPLSSFNYETPDDPDFRRAWALSNLQPLWAKDNHSKGAKLDWKPTKRPCGDYAKTQNTLSEGENLRA